ncbi:MAG: rRNA maturation RNase YbeY [Acetobacterium sp.]
MIVVAFDNRSDLMIEDAQLEEIEEVMMRTLLHQEIGVECEISFSFVSPTEIQSLNAEYRGIDEPTDVLSFPMYDHLMDNLESVLKENQCLPLLIGDVVINTQQAKCQAEEYGNSLTRELCYLSVHSVLHLLGYDHMEDEEKSIMRIIEKDLMGDD